MFIWEIGKKISSMPKDFISMATAKNIKESFQMAKNMVEEYIITKVELVMTENGIKIEKMGLEFIHILMDKDTKETGLMERSMAKELIIIKMEISIQAIG